MKIEHDPKMKWEFELNEDPRKSKVILFIGGKRWNIPVRYIKCEQSVDGFLSGEIQIFIHKGNCKFKIKKYDNTILP